MVSSNGKSHLDLSESLKSLGADTGGVLNGKMFFDMLYCCSSQ